MKHKGPSSSKPLDMMIPHHYTHTVRLHNATLTNIPPPQFSCRLCLRLGGRLGGLGLGRLGRRLRRSSRGISGGLGLRRRPKGLKMLVR
jgi:hypothetical protein